MGSTDQKPAEGERRAVSGYRSQYLVSAEITLHQLNQGNLEWIRVADPEAEQVDDFQIASQSRIDAYQVKWKKYPGLVTLNDLTSKDDSSDPLFKQLADGWQKLRNQHPNRRVVVHLVTPESPSDSNNAWLPGSAGESKAYHFSAFIHQAWRPARKEESLDSEGQWSEVWTELQNTTGLSDDLFEEFVLDCVLDFGKKLPHENDDICQIADLIFATAAGREQVVEMSREKLLRDLGWQERYQFRNTHTFPDPEFVYRPIQTTAEELRNAIDQLGGGYIGVFGSPGSGKSTLLSKTLRSLPARLIRYYAYLPKSPSSTSMRGEAINFLHDITLNFWRTRIGPSERPDPSDRSTLLSIFHEQIREAAKDFSHTGTKTIILVDGLDHINREHSPKRSLLNDLPTPEEVPDGVYFVLGSQTDQLEDLPPRIKRTLRPKEGANERRISMSNLDRQDVEAISKTAIPQLPPNQRREVFELSGGHPLALIYLLRQLQNAESNKERVEILSDAVPYEEDIEKDYWSHWEKVKGEDDLIETLGLMARVRGPIPIRWVSSWADRMTLRKLKQFFVQYFREDSYERWTFFHNSFRLFIQNRTAEKLAGKTRDECEREYHRNLAERFKTSEEPWKWETLYHLYQAGQHEEVVELATLDWFRNQQLDFRPLEAVQSDIQLALRSAADVQSGVSLLRLTLADAEAEQRSMVIDEHSLAGLLLDVGKPLLAASQIRDGNRLRGRDRLGSRREAEENALRQSVRFAEQGLLREGFRIFEIAEPLDLLSGRLIEDDSDRPRNLWDLLVAWVEAASLFREAEKVMDNVRQIRVEPRRSDDFDVEELSSRFQRGLAVRAGVSCARRSEWSDWEIYHKWLEAESDHSRIHLRLRSTEAALNNGDRDRAREVFNPLLLRYDVPSVSIDDDGQHRFETCVDVAELALRLDYDEEVARQWIGNLPRLPLRGDQPSQRQWPSTEVLRFRRAQLSYYLGEDQKPNELAIQAEKQTTFSGRTENDYPNYRRLGRAVYEIADLWARGKKGQIQEPAAFLRKIQWVLDWIGRESRSHSTSFRLKFSDTKEELTRWIIQAAHQHGDEVIDNLSKDFVKRWNNSDSSWPTAVRRTSILEFSRLGKDRTWIISELEELESETPSEDSPRGRADLKASQAETWLSLEETERAKDRLRRMVRFSRGLMEEGDLQLSTWIDFLTRINDAHPEKAGDRLRTMLRRLAVSRGEGLSGAIMDFLAEVFRQSPWQAAHLVPGLQEQEMLTHRNSLSVILRCAAMSEDPPLTEVLHALVELAVPFDQPGHPDVFEPLFDALSQGSGRSEVLRAARYAVKRIRTDALRSQRTEWLRAVAEALRTLSIPPSQTGLSSREWTDADSGDDQDDQKLPLENGKEITVDQILEASDLSQLDALLSRIDWGQAKGLFPWSDIAEHFIQQAERDEEIFEFLVVIKKHLESDSLKRVLTTLCENLRDREVREEVARSVASNALEYSEPRGWNPWMDGGSRMHPLFLLREASPTEAREKAISLFAKDAESRFRSSHRLLAHLSEIAELLTEELPIQPLWSDVENYLDELYVALDVQPLPTLEKHLMQFGDELEDSSSRAVAQLISLYLDYPSQVVAQGAIRASVTTLLSGSDTVQEALKNFSERTELATERLLSVLEAAATEEAESIEPFRQDLDELIRSPNFNLRCRASSLRSLLGDDPSIPQKERDLPGTYRIALPPHSEVGPDRELSGRSRPKVINDPVERQRPLNRTIEQLANYLEIDPEPLLYRTAELMDELRSEWTWLSKFGNVTDDKMSRFLRRAHIRITHNKSHIAPAELAISHVAAELWDAGYFGRSDLNQVDALISRCDPSLLMPRPGQRPPWITTVGGISENISHPPIPEDWLDLSDSAFTLFSTQTNDGDVIVGEKTEQAFIGSNQRAEEDRFSFTRMRSPSNFWKGNGGGGPLPFPTVIDAPSSDYGKLRAPIEHLTIANQQRRMETPGTGWLALNPTVAQRMNWQLAENGLFRWVDGNNNLMAESLWWRDGLPSRYDRVADCIAGSGWCVTLTGRGYRQMKEWTNRLWHGGVIRRRKGQFGEDGSRHAQSVLHKL